MSVYSMLTPDDANREYLQVFRDRMGDIPTVIEFRNAGWITDEAESAAASVLER